MNHHHRKVLHSLFSHPINGNIAMKDIESVRRIIKTRSTQLR